MVKILKFLNEYGTPKRHLAGMIGVDTTTLYFYLEPEKYPGRNVGEKSLEKIAKFESRSLRSIREDYERRKAEVVA